MGQYYSRIVRYAVAMWLQRLKDGRKQLIGFTLQTAVVFVILYFLPALGNLSDKAGEIGTLAIAVLTTLALQFIWDLMRAPVRIDQFQREDLGLALDQMRNALDDDKHLRVLGALYDEGKTLAETNRRSASLQDAYVDWKTRCESYLDEHYEFPILHQFRNSRDQFMSDFSDRSRSKTQYHQLLGELEGKLSALDSIIRMSGGRLLPNFFHRVLERENNPVYKYLAPIPSDSAGD